MHCLLYEVIEMHFWNSILYLIKTLLYQSRWTIPSFKGDRNIKSSDAMNHLSLFKYALLYILSSFCNHPDEEERVPRRYFFCGSSLFFSVLCLLCLCARLFICAL